jgi:hypothetical protein
MRRRRMSVFMLVIPVGATAVSPLSAGEGPQEPLFPPRTSGQGVPLVGITPDGDRFVGTFALESFSAKGDELRAMKVSNGPTLDREAIIARIRHAKDIEGKSSSPIADEVKAEGMATFSGRGTCEKSNVSRFYKAKKA